MVVPSQKGFTLVEILIVLSIFAILTLMTSTALFAVISANKTMQMNSKRLAQLQLAMTLLERDITQSICRPIIDQMGKEVGPLIANTDYLELTHAGVANPLAQNTRCTLQRVAYLKTKTHLIRQTWPVLDRTATTLPSERVLIEDINSLQFRLFDNDLRFYTKWPPPTQLSNLLPRAIEVKITLSTWGELTRLFYLPAQISS